MKATIDIPEDLYRKVKAKSALEGRPVRAVAIQLFRDWVGEWTNQPGGEPFVSVGELMGDACGIIDSGMNDLATNPIHLEGLGIDAPGDR